MNNMKRCKICVLPDTFPGIRFNTEGICNYCQSFKGKKNLEDKKQKFRQKFEALIAENKGRSSYDALMCYSGGKDSTYVLALLKQEYGMDTLPVTYDNGFLPAQTITNIQTVTDKLGLDHTLFKPRWDMLRKIFATCAVENIYPAQTLTRASTICTSCMAIVKFHALRTAIEKDIPFIVFGWSPGQIPVASSIMKNNPQMIKTMQKSTFDPLYEIVGDKIRPYFLEDKHFSEGYNFPHNISPLAFLDYDEEKILAKMKSLGWKRPEHIDANSTNCLLNSFANVVHKKAHGFHPYAFEMAKLVREGYMEREVALEKITQAEDPQTVEQSKKKLAL
jgi:tRNA(Ile)-lysidine synthase TilS/MesJ